MQNPEDIIFDKDSSYSKEHLIQALANLGQRIGIKGDGIAYKSFSFNDILLNDNYSSNDYIGFIEYIESNNNIKALYGVANKLNLEKSITIDTSYDVNNILNFNSEVSFSIPVNGIEKYSKNSICINNDKELTFMLACKQIGYNDGDENNTILLYYKFNIYTNKLICCYKLYHYLKNSNNENYYCLLNINNESLNNYKLSINIFNSSSLVVGDESINTEYQQKFENLFKFSNYSSTASIPYSIINSNYENVENLLIYNETNTDFNSAISLILNTPKSQLYHSKTIDLLFDTQKNELLAINENDFNDIVEFYYNEYNLNINQIIYDINEEINKLYVNIFNYYNEKFYLESKATLIKRILLKIYERSIDNTYAIGERLYIPLDYKFHYICNSNNELNIYYSNNIYVTYTSLDNVNLLNFWDSNNNLVFDYDLLNKLKVYNFEINYNSYIENLINSITIKDVYTMPYINANNNWCINDSDTKIKAIGKDAGNPNIIIIYSNDINNLEDSYELLNAVSNKEELLKATYDQKWFNVNNALFENTYNVIIDCCTYIPEITSENYEYFKDSIILSISDLECLRYDDYKDKYKGSYILTLWHLNNESLPQFECINQVNSNTALALGSTVNLLNELSDTSIANLNSQDLILLKSIISNVAQETLNVNMNNWLILKNKQSEEYSTNYSNDLNMIVQYDDDITINTNHIVHSHSKSRYISDINNIATTNSLYPKYTYKTETTTVTNDNIKVIINKLTNVSQINSNILVNGKSITNIESLIEKLELKEKNVSISDINEIKSTSILVSNSNYYEYVFNSNVPTLDYKEIFNRNFNLINRLNIISIDNNGKLYNGYIGSSYNESDKSVLHIGTSNLNINIGSDTLINESDRNSFNTYSTLSLDFDKIKINSNNIHLLKEPYYSYNLNNINFTVSNIKLIGMYSLINNTSNNISTMFAYDKSNVTYYLSIETIMNKLNVSIASYNYVNIHHNLKDDKDKGIIHNQIINNLHMILIDSDLIYGDSLLNNKNILYVKKELEVMYYVNTIIDSNTTMQAINIFLTFK